MAPDPRHLAHQSASKLSQLLADTIMHHAPWTAEVNEETRRRVTDAWLERLEQHATKVVGPLIDHVTADVATPEPIASLLQHAHTPSAQFGSTIQQFFVYGVMFSLASTLMQPLTQSTGNDIWAAHPDRPLSPPDLATMVVRGIGKGDSSGVEVPEWATEMAKQSGLAPELFASIVGTAGMAPDMTVLFEMIRRGVITKEQLTRGIKQGDIKDEWIPYVEKMRYVTVSPTDMVRAAVQNQLPYDEAAHWAHAVGLEPVDWVGGNPDWFKILYDIAGRPPGPSEAGRMALRGIIPVEGAGPAETTFQQAIAESDVKTKWTDALWQLMQYVPPPGEVRTLLLHGGIDHATAVDIWKKDGIPEAIAEAYAHVTSLEQITQDKALAKGDIETMLQEQLITDEQAKTYLARIGYEGANAQFIINMAHFRYELEALRTAVRTVGRYYTTWKLDAAGASKAFQSLGLTVDQATNLVDRLEVERQATSPLPTASQISGAHYYGVVPTEVAMSMLQDLGYSPWRAWFILSTRMHSPLPHEPAEGRPAGQPSSVSFAQQAYDTSVGDAKMLLDGQIALAKTQYLDITPPNRSGYDQAVATARSAYDQTVAAARQALAQSQ